MDKTNQTIWRPTFKGNINEEEKNQDQTDNVIEKAATTDYVGREQSHAQLEQKLCNIPDRPSVDNLRNQTFDTIAKELRNSIEYNRRMSSVKRNTEPGPASRMSRKISQVSSRRSTPLTGHSPVRLKGSLKKPLPPGLPQYTLNIPIEGLDPERKTIHWEQYDNYCDDGCTTSTNHFSITRQLGCFSCCVCCILPSIVGLILFSVAYSAYNEYDTIETK